MLTINNSHSQSHRLFKAVIVAENIALSKRFNPLTVTYFVSGRAVKLRHKTPYKI